MIPATSTLDSNILDAVLVLEDGRIFWGNSFGAYGETIGEVVFNTSICGYQEIMTDPSYCKQIVVMTSSQIGNYGINELDVESNKLHIEGLIVKEYCSKLKNWRKTDTLDAYMKTNGIVGIQGIDTRALTRHIRDKGAMMGIISSRDLNEKRLTKKVQNAPGIVGIDLVRRVTCGDSYIWERKSSSTWVDLIGNYEPNLALDGYFKVVVYDFGVKHNILRRLRSRGCDLKVVPAHTSWKVVIDENPDGIFLSNGPGDPAAVTYAIDNVRNLIGKKPIFGICLGHQILGLAFGETTSKLKFGHRGANHPVINLKTKKVEITSQNHSFIVNINSLPKDEIEHTHINLNDDTLEGMRHKTLPIFSVQYHPEASPGPHDADYLFDEFIAMMRTFKKNNNSG